MNECDATNIGHLQIWDSYGVLFFLPQMHGLYNVNMIYKFALMNECDATNIGHLQI